VFVAELKLALVVGTPQVIRVQARRKRSSLGTCPGPAGLCHQTVSIHNGMNGAVSWHLHVRRQSTQQQFVDLARSPMRFFQRFTRNFWYSILTVVGEFVAAKASKINNAKSGNAGRTIFSSTLFPDCIADALPECYRDDRPYLPIPYFWGLCGPVQCQSNL